MGKWDTDYIMRLKDVTKHCKLILVSVLVQ